jgi:hypothetical protein
MEYITDSDRIMEEWETINYGRNGTMKDWIRIIILHLFGLAPAGCLAAPDNGP